VITLDNNKEIIAILRIHRDNATYDVEFPLTITANDLIIGLNKGFNLGMDTSDLAACYLKTENPIALLKGNKELSEFGLHNGTIIHYTS
jgi:uncharacterized ubiquitin-like protein YukD